MPREAEPELTIDSSETDVLAELMALEPLFHRPEHGTTRADFERMTDADFWEVGASGRCYSRSYVLTLLEQRYSLPVNPEETLHASDFRCRFLCNKTYLLTYNLIQNEIRRTRRSTIWQRTHEGWKVIFHQGTIIQDTEKG